MTKSRMVPLNAVGPARGPTIKELLTYVACQGSSFSRSGHVEVSGPTGNGCVTCAALQPDTRGATGAVYHPAVTTASAREAAISAGNRTAYGSPNSYSF